LLIDDIINYLLAMRFLSASCIHPIAQPAVRDHVLVMEDDGTIADLVPKESVSEASIEYFEGDLVPGFVNAHCHLELSHLRNKLPEKTGLPDFLNKVVSQRETAEQEVQEAMQIADKEMFDAGIVAVGDISNNSDSFKIKAKSGIFYHNLIELLGFNPKNAENAFLSGIKLLEQLKELGLKGSLVPHAPYSVSPKLMEDISGKCAIDGLPTSIHMLESNDENEFFIQGTGLYRRLYHDLNMDIEFFEAPGLTSLEAVLPHLNTEARTLLVHNTIATASDLEYAVQKHPNLYWCFCPNANLYIEDRLPDITQLISAMPEGRAVLGTDSLASNHQLSVLDEILCILKAFPEITFEELLPWATINGATYLGISDQFGSFEKGKRPGIVQVLKGKAQRLF